MIVSWNELQRTCRKAFCGLGVAAGADDDSAFAVLWLQARGFDALTPLDAALRALEHTPPQPLGLGRRAGHADVLDGDGQPAVSVASDALDLAVARAVEQGGRSEVLLTGVKGGIFVAGALPRRPVPGHRARVHWYERGGALRRLDAAAGGECRVYGATAKHSGPVSGDPLGPGEDMVRIVIGELRRDEETDRDRRMTRDGSWRLDIDAAELERRALHSVTHGIEVPDPLWSRLLEFAKRTLVPASRASRERGAGGGEYDD